jgi:excisionase family DNA binding protein
VGQEPPCSFVYASGPLRSPGKPVRGAESPTNVPRAPDRGAAYFVVAPAAPTCIDCPNVYAYSRRGFPFPTEALSASLPGAEPVQRGTIPLVEEGDYYSVSQAAKVLKVTHGRIRQMLGSGELEGEKDEAGHWIIPAHAVHDRPRPPRVERTGTTVSSSSGEAASEPPEASQSLSDLLDRVARLERELGRSEGARELEAVARSTLEEQLQRERERADRLEEEVRSARRSWWRKFFGVE